MDVSGIQLNCHFFTVVEIEFDLDPRKIVDPGKLDSVFDFMRGMANAVGKDVVLTLENHPQHVIFRCRPGSIRIEHTGGPFR